MSMGWAGIIGSSLAAGASGAMSSVAKDIDEEQKAAMQALRDRQLAQLARESHAINAKASADLAFENADRDAAKKEELDSKYAGGRLERRTAEEKMKTDEDIRKAEALNKMPRPERTHTPEEKEELASRSEANRARAREADSRASKNDRGPAEKPEKPENLKPQKYVPVKGSPGLEYDELTDTYRKTVKSVKGKEAKKGIISYFDEPAVEGVEGGYEYLDANRKPISADAVESKRRERSGYKPKGDESAPAAPKGQSAAGAGKSPYPDGTRLKDKKGKSYVVKNGVPVAI